MNHGEMRMMEGRVLGVGAVFRMCYRMGMRIWRLIFTLMVIGIMVVGGRLIGMGICLIGECGECSKDGVEIGRIAVL